MFTLTESMEEKINGMLALAITNQWLTPNTSQAEVFETMDAMLLALWIAFPELDTVDSSDVKAAIAEYTTTILTEVFC